MSPVISKTINVGSRDSELALIQSRHIIQLLQMSNPHTVFNIIPKSTKGDKILNVTLSKIGDKSLFTKELETALISGEVDFVVHSMKDLQTTLPPGLALGCVCSRESLEDAVLMSPQYRGYKLEDLPAGSVIGTSAVRRVAQLKRAYPHLNISPVRGNLNTRLKKLDDPKHAKEIGKGDGTSYAALILARAGIERMGWEDRIDQILDSTENLYAVGQGALAIECRIDDLETLSLLSTIHDESSALTCISERSLLLNLEGGCSTPIAVRSWTRGDWRLGLSAAVYSLDGSKCIDASMQSQLPLTDEEAAAIDLEEEEKKVQSSYDNNHTLVNTIHALKRVRGNSESESGKSPEAVPSKRKRTASQSGVDSIQLTDTALSEPRSGRMPQKSQRLYAGVLIHPICEIGRKRMVSACRLGTKLAEELRNKGATKLLSEIKCQELESKLSTAAPVTPTDHHCCTSSSSFSLNSLDNRQVNE